MQEELITFKTAKLAKEKGFDIKVWDYFQITTAKNPSELCTPSKTNWNNYEPTLSRPTQSLLAKWLRKVHNIHIEITDWELEKWYIKLRDGRNNKYTVRNIVNFEEFIEESSYEQALEKGLYEGLKLITNR